MHSETQTRINTILGEPMAKRVYPQPLSQVKPNGMDRSRAQARYLYQNETGAEIMSTWRFRFGSGEKMILPDQPCPFCMDEANRDAECPYKCHDGRIWGITAREDGLPAVRRTLYRLPDLMSANVVFVVEGERNVDDLSRALGMYIKAEGGIAFGQLVLDRVGVTTNQGGAGAWKPEYEYGRDFRRKTVVVLRDNDLPGLMHQVSVCEDVAKHAREVWTLELPGMGEGEDISDFLERHTIKDFIGLWPTAKRYESPAKKYLTHTEEDAQRVVLVKPSTLRRAGASDDHDWLVPGLIARGRRGLVVSAPKVGKSLLFCDLALCLGANRGFLGGKPYGKPVRTALISREDEADELFFRLQALGADKGLTWDEIDANITVNTRLQTSRFNINNAQERVEMAEWLKADKTELAVFDVLNKISAGIDLNSSSDATRTMQNFDEISHVSGAQIVVIHHTGKSGSTMGSTSIEGWADFVIRLERHPDGDESLKTMHLRTKSSSAVPPRTLKYSQSEDKKQSRIQLVEARPVAVSTKPQRPRLISNGGGTYHDAY